MYEIPKLGDEDNHYDGSKIFTWLADICGLSVDLINFLVCQILALFFASLFRSYLHPLKVSTNIRHAFGLTLGMIFGYFCFGQQAIHIAGLPAVCYIIIRTQNPEIVQRLVMVVSLVYLSLVHIHRLYYDYGSYSLDITGPLMVITQKVTLLTFSIHDGLTRDANELSKQQQFYAVRKLPSALEFFAYVLHFQSLMAGPLVVYKDYIEFIEGTNILKHSNANNNIDKSGCGKEIVVEPSPKKAVVKKIIGSVICAFIFKKFVSVYPIKKLSEEDFLENTTFVYKLWYICMSTTVVRFKYYHAWLLSDAICNNSGLGFNGFEKDGNPKWDLISNINVIGFELGTNLRDAINNWNMGTNRWLRMVVYDRVPKKYGTFLTFSLSALWHGFYPGYYVTFTSGALIVEAARSARKMFRHRFQHTELARISYDILTVFTTRLFMGYLTFPFVLLEFKASVHLYLKFYMCLHLVGLITIYVLPRFLHGERQQQKQSTKKSTDHTITNCNGSMKLVDGVTLDRIDNHNAITVNGINHKTEDDNVCDTNKTNNNEKLDTKLNGIDNNNTNETDNNLTKNDVNNTRISDKNNFSYNGENGKNIASLSSKIRERIDSETRNLEDLIDKTVTGIVELKDDLMRVNDNDGLRKRKNSEILSKSNDGIDRVDAFLRKEINMAVNQVNVLPAVLSNSHGD